MELLSPQTKYALTRFPRFELSYETISHTKVYTNYDIGMAIPQGKKGYMWFTFDKQQDVCYLFELNREKKITKGNKISLDFEWSLSLGTVLYGTIISDETGSTTAFVIEEILYYKGVSLDTARQIDRLSFLHKLFTHITQNTKNIQIRLPVMWKADIHDNDKTYPDTLPTSVPYVVHHLQYRSSMDTMPFINVFVARKGVVQPVAPPIIALKPQYDYVPAKMSFMKPQYRCPTIFQVSADIQFDIYHLFAYGKNNQRIYYNIANVPTYTTSVFLNNLFRKIRENTNLDYIEESDDEEDFQNLKEDKYVDTTKTLLMTCIFDRKFKKWTPVSVAHNKSKVVHISQL
jgi:hypothetical protein